MVVVSVCGGDRGVDMGGDGNGVGFFGLKSLWLDMVDGLSDILSP